ncbi:hypothetical protein [Nostoc sp. UHCC 0251]|uniref:hypothetical protein n=1 Tax=Nostoc sp. UHCC 0251 TaxID=3110240 RepID=UPI002B21E468|nr:hypothetical protein [Nostoc sp. UHCC 0251]MEA5627404.1 hypothetical protein [Nostoc sp. UHCC 0251]
MSSLEIPLVWGKKAIATFPEPAIAFCICVVIDVVASHNTLNLELAKPNILLLLASDRSYQAGYTARQATGEFQ